MGRQCCPNYLQTCFGIKTAWKIAYRSWRVAQSSERMFPGGQVLTMTKRGMGDSELKIDWFRQA